MAYFDTLKYVDGSGTTQEIALKFANVAAGPAGVRTRFTPRSHAASEFQITWPLPPETALVIPFKSRCEVWAGRSSSDGSANSFSGGTRLFAGRRWDRQGSVAGGRVQTSITLMDAWKDLTKITMQMAWRKITGGTLASPTYGTFTWPDLVLFQPFPGVTYSPSPVNYTINTWQQIVDIINYAASLSGTDAVQLQIGSSPEFTPCYVNWYPLRVAKCAEAITACLRAHPAVYTEIDYTTTPPTIHFRNRSNMTALTLPYASKLSDGTFHIASDIEPLDELVPDAVRIFYKITGSYNGRPVVSNATDIYPSGGSTNTLLDMDYSVDVSGGSVQETRVTFQSTALNPADLALWRQKVASLRQISEGGQIPNDGDAGALAFVDTAAYNAGSHPKGIQIIGDDGTDYSSSYASVLPYFSEQDIYSWFTLEDESAVTAVKVTVKAYFSYQKISPAAGGVNITDNFGEHLHTFRLLLTNAPSDIYVFKQTLAVGESIPANLAQALYTELADPQWKLRHEMIQTASSASTLPTLVKPGKHKVNLSGGDSAWTTMNAVPENVAIELWRDASGKLVAHHTISCGPVNHLEPGYLVQLANLFINRNRAGIDPNQRLYGTTASSQVDLTSTPPKENSVPGEPVPVENNNVYVTGGAIAGQTIQSAKKVSDILAATTPVPVVDATSMKTMQPREIKVCDDAGNPYYIIVQATAGHTKS